MLSNSKDIDALDGLGVAGRKGRRRLEQEPPAARGQGRIDQPRMPLEMVSGGAVLPPGSIAANCSPSATGSCVWITVHQGCRGGPRAAGSAPECRSRTIGRLVHRRPPEHQQVERLAVAVGAEVALRLAHDGPGPGPAGRADLFGPSPRAVELRVEQPRTQVPGQYAAVRRAQGLRGGRHRPPAGVSIARWHRRPAGGSSARWHRRLAGGPQAGSLCHRRRGDDPNSACLRLGEQFRRGRLVEPDGVEAQPDQQRQGLAPILDGTRKDRPARRQEHRPGHFDRHFFRPLHRWTGYHRLVRDEQGSSRSAAGRRHRCRAGFPEGHRRDACATEPCATEPCATEPCATDPCAAEPCAACRGTKPARSRSSIQTLVTPGPP